MFRVWKRLYTLQQLAKKSNICLMGPPGSGKTSVSRIIGKKLNMPVYDIDNDHLETVWKTSVASKLTSLGDEKFLDAESDATIAVNKKNTIISLTGSNPLRKAAMDHLRKDGIIVFLDVDQAEIVKRCHMMKVDRIVGQATKSLEDILKFRTGIYEGAYDLRIIVGKQDSLEQIAEKVLEQLQKDQRFFSTRDDAGVAKETQPPVLFQDVVRTGLAPDRGLYFPKYIPKFSLSQLERLVNLSYQERALRILEAFPIGLLAPAAFRDMINKAYSSFLNPNLPLPLSNLEHNQFLLEEYHGPTASFKDLALQLTPHLFQYAIQASNQGNEDFLFVVATSGDTGSACLQGFGQHANTPVVVLYPAQGVSPVQQVQMTSATGDCLVLGVQGDFDFCQTCVKDIFNSPQLAQEFKQEHLVELTSGNSINWGRLWPQIPYSFSAYLDLVKNGTIKLGEKMDFCVPTGNFGNILGAVIARRMGLPLGNLIAACNENNILAEFLSSGLFDRRGRLLKKTPAPSIDILLPSNLERYLYLLSGDAGSIKRLFQQHADYGYFQVSGELLELVRGEVLSGWASSGEVLTCIRDTYTRTGQLLDPHTAVGKIVADRLVPLRAAKHPMVIASTAHFSKFPTAVLSALGRESVTRLAGESEQAAVGRLLGELRRIPSLSSSQPRMDAMVTQRIVHTDVVPANKALIVQHIRQFLQRRTALRRSGKKQNIKV